MLPIAIYTHADCLEHDTGAGHPECTERLEVIWDAIKNSPRANQFEFIDAPKATKSQLLLAHDAAQVEQVYETSPASGYAQLDADTVMSPGSLDAALRAAGAGIAAVDAVLAGTYHHAFCAVRPPGHHATRHRAMGFCLFNNIAVAALYAKKQHGLRVAIVDFDVHHGNGTQDIIASESDILFISSHQSPFYPGTGMLAENRTGHILNVPLPHGTDGASYRTIFTKLMLPVLEAFAPQLLLVSAGFDAHRDDPLAGLQLVENDYRWIGQQLSSVAQKHCAGKTVSFLEGGYNLDVLGESVAAYLEGLA